MKARIYAYVMVSEKSSREFLDELLEDVSQLRDIDFHILYGFKPPKVPVQRRKEIHQNVPDHYSHVMWFDDDDRIDVEEYQRIIDFIHGNPEVQTVRIMEQAFDDEGFIAYGNYCCKGVVSLDLLKEVSNDERTWCCTALIHISKKSSNITVDWPNVAYYWRQHTNQLSKLAQ